MPTANSQGFLVAGVAPLTPATPITGTVNINSGAVIPPLTSITDSYTFTGALTTDINWGISPRPTAGTSLPNIIPYGLQLSASSVSATNTITVTWTNTTGTPITPPPSSTWYYAVFNEYIR
jgi:hypothetical protein